MIKKILKSVLIALFALLSIVFGILSFRSPSAKEFDNLAEFEKYLNSVSPIQYNDFKKESRYLEMSDGTQIAIDIFVPVGKEDEKFPVIFNLTPYNRSNYVPLKWYERIALKWKTGYWGPILDRSISFTHSNLIARGYAYVVGDMRGTGASSGKFVPMSPTLGEDGASIINWIEKQPWSNGKVGMLGQSFGGWSQFAIASNQPKALKCIAPALIFFETYSECVRPGGIAAESWLKPYSEYLITLNYNQLDNSKERFNLPAYPTAPVIDEDGDGSLVDEIPILSGKQGRSFIEQDIPIYSDGKRREHNYYFEYTKQHLENLRADFILEKSYGYFDAIAPTETEGINFSFAQSSPGSMIPKVIEANIAVLNIGAWFDPFLKGTAQLHATMINQGGNSRLLITPRFHVPTKDALTIYGDYLNYIGNPSQQQFLHTLRFLDYHLKDAKNGWENEDPVLIYSMHEGWKNYRSWPLNEEVKKEFYLDERNSLVTEEPDSSRVKYAVDFDHSSSYGEEKQSKWNMVRPMRYLMDRTENDKKTVFFETDVLREDLEITGHPIAEIFIGSNQPNADIFVYLTDVDETGKSIYITEGQLRASWHNEFDPNLQVQNVVEVMPKLPWHGFEQGMERLDPTANDSIVKMKLDLFPTSWVVKKGHKLRVSIAGVDKNNFEINPSWILKSGEVDATTDLFIFTGEKYASKIILPKIDP